MTQPTETEQHGTSPPAIVAAAAIPALDHSEAGRLAQAELERFLAVVETLSGDDWQRPTDCTAWTVRDVVAHQAGAYAGFASWGQFRRQMSARPAAGQMMVDGLNARQVADRAGHSPAELVAELRRVGPQAIRTRQRLPWPLRKLPIPFGPPLGTVALEYLTDLIYTRDTWMHRADICRATGRPFVQTADHDGRIVALVLRDLAQALEPHLGGRAVQFDLAGTAGGRYRIGRAAEPSATIAMDVLAFNRLASGRVNAAAASQQALFTVSSDGAFAGTVLARVAVPY